MLRLLVVSAVLSLSVILSSNGMAKQEPTEIPWVFNGCIDFAESACGDADADGYLNWFEQSVGSDPNDADSTPEYRLFDEQWRSNTCDDKVDNDLDGLADNGDVGCRLNCKDFGPNERCKDPDLDGWLTYVEDRYGSNPNNPLSTPEGIPGTCNDGTDNDLDGDVDGGDSGCGISDCIDFDNEWGCAPL